MTIKTTKFDHIRSFESMGFKVSHEKRQQKTKCHKGNECQNPTAQNQNDTCVSINIDDGVWNCHKCGAGGTVAEHASKYKSPDKSSFRGLGATNDPVLDFFSGRGIDENVVKSNKIVRSGDWIVFPYFKNGVLVNTKTRHLKKKDFRQTAGAMPTMYNHDRCIEPESIFIVEGELDAMSFEMAGFTNVTSPNQGAPNANDKNVDKKLECLENSWDILEGKDDIIIAVDDDENGRRLERELIRRLGAERCKTLSWLDSKDANEFLMANGVEKLREHIENNTEIVPVSGIWTVDDAWESMLDGFHNGKKRGETTHIPNVDNAWTWRTGDLNLWTGYNNEGKTTFLNQLLLLRAKNDGEKIGVFSPENYPADEFFDDLIHTLVGKSTDPYYKNQMTESEYKSAAQFISKHFFIVYPDQENSLDVLFEKFTFLVRRHGIRHTVFDPWNQIDHNMRPGEREDLYISRVLSRFKRFAVENDVSVNIVAHQNTPRELDGAGNYLAPSKYRLKGGGTFSDKVDNVLAIWRPYYNTDKVDPTIHFISQKIKKQRLVGIPQSIELTFDFKSNRYFSDDKSPFDDVRLSESQNNLIVDENLNVIPDPLKRISIDELPF